MPDSPGRDARYYLPIGNRARDHSSGGNDCAASNRNTIKNFRTCSDPDIVSYCNAAIVHALFVDEELTVIEAMVSCYYCRHRADPNAPTDYQIPTAVKSAIGTNCAMWPNL
jgi:hypothetical protein